MEGRSSQERATRAKARRREGARWFKKLEAQCRGKEGKRAVASQEELGREQGKTCAGFEKLLGLMD